MSSPSARAQDGYRPGFGTSFPAGQLQWWQQPLDCRWPLAFCSLANVLCFNGQTLGHYANQCLQPRARPAGPWASPPSLPDPSGYLGRVLALLGLLLSLKVFAHLPVSPCPTIDLCLSHSVFPTLLYLNNPPSSLLSLSGCPSYFRFQQCLDPSLFQQCCHQFLISRAPPILGRCC
jgi:hypothetical protein